MDCKEYYNIRNQLKDGDMVLYRGHGFMSKSINYFDNSFYNHIGIVKWIGNRLFTIDMWTHGIEIVPLSRRMKGYDKFCIARIKDKSVDFIDKALDSVFEKIERDTKYDYFLLPRIAFYKKTGIDLVGLGKIDRDICSELCRYFSNNLEVDCYKNVNLITPQDFIRKKDDKEVEILFDLSPQI